MNKEMTREEIDERTKKLEIVVQMMEEEYMPSTVWKNLKWALEAIRFLLKEKP